MKSKDFTGIAINPALKAGGILEARIVLARNRLSRMEQQMGLVQLVQKALQDIQRQVPHVRPDGRPNIQQAQGGKGGRAVVTLSGVQPADGRPIRGWIGALITPLYSFAVYALVMGERWEHYQPRLDALFASLQARGGLSAIGAWSRPWWGSGGGSTQRPSDREAARERCSLSWRAT